MVYNLITFEMPLYNLRGNTQYQGDLTPPAEGILIETLAQQITARMELPQLGATNGTQGLPVASPMVMMMQFMQTSMYQQ